MCCTGVVQGYPCPCRDSFALLQKGSESHAEKYDRWIDRLEVQIKTPLRALMAHEEKMTLRVLYDKGPDLWDYTTTQSGATHPTLARGQTRHTQAPQSNGYIYTLICNTRSHGTTEPTIARLVSICRLGAVVGTQNSWSCRQRTVMTYEDREGPPAVGLYSSFSLPGSDLPSLAQGKLVRTRIC